MTKDTAIGMLKLGETTSEIMDILECIVEEYNELQSETVDQDIDF